MADQMLGMDPIEVQRLGNALQDGASLIRSKVTELERRIHEVSWQGVDGQRFRTQWWPEHKARLNSVATDLDGFGQSALNNASEQLHVSGANEASSGGPVLTVVNNPGMQGGTYNPQQPGGYLQGGMSAPPGAPGPVEPSPAPVSGGAVGSSEGSLAGSNRSAAEVQHAFESRSAELMASDSAAHRAGGGDAYQCTSWAAFRWRELGYDGPLEIADGGLMAGQNGGSVGAMPTLGAMASYGGDLGHVMIVEEIRQLPGGGMEVRFSEMNTGSDGSSWQQASPQEYRSSRVMTYDPGSGAWLQNGVSKGPITFASIPR